MFALVIFWLVRYALTLVLLYVLLAATVDSMLTPLANKKFGAITLAVVVMLPVVVTVAVVR